MRHDHRRKTWTIRPNRNGSLHSRDYRTAKHDLIVSIGITVATCTWNHNDRDPAEHQPLRRLTIASIARIPFSIFVRADTFAE